MAEEITQKVADWLKQMGLKGIMRVEEEPRIIVNYSIEGHVFQVQLISSDQWINAKALVARIDDIPKSERGKLYQKALTGNWALNEVTYSCDPEHGHIWCETDMPAETTYENFAVEFSSIPFGIQYFITEIAPTIHFAIRDTTYYV